MMRMRVATADDADKMTAVARACFGDGAWSVEQFLPRAGRHIEIAEVAQVCIGYGVITWVADEAELEAMAVAEPYRRQGVARGLLSRLRMVGMRQGARAMYLEVRQSNAVARTFYARQGFRICGQRSHYYRAPDEDAVLMRLELI